MPKGGGDEPRYPVRAVINRTGLTADVLRAWERRYGAVAPDRSAGGQRLYSEDDVERLTLLRRATLAGHSIAEVARLDVAALEALLDKPAAAGRTTTSDAYDAIVDSAMWATERLDASGVEGALKRGAMAFGSTALVDQIISRFLRRVGERWHEGTLSPAHEHLASTAVRRVLSWSIDAYQISPRAPRVIVATPSGEQHEFGALLAAAAAADEGWRVVYLGASLPAANIADAAQQVGARAVALSAVYANGAATMEEIRETARLLPSPTKLLAGGAAAQLHGDALAAAGVRVLADMPALRRMLQRLNGAPAEPTHDASG